MFWFIPQPCFILIQPLPQYCDFTDEHLSVVFQSVSLKMVSRCEAETSGDNIHNYNNYSRPQPYIPYHNLDNYEVGRESL